MTQIEAIYQNGVFKPLIDVGLVENQRVRLNVEPIQVTEAATWLAEAKALQLRIISQRGFFPDSALDIAEDRGR